MRFSPGCWCCESCEGCARRPETLCVVIEPCGCFGFFTESYTVQVEWNDDPFFYYIGESEITGPTPLTADRVLVELYPPEAVAGVPCDPYWVLGVRFRNTFSGLYDLVMWWDIFLAPDGTIYTEHDGGGYVCGPRGTWTCDPLSMVIPPGDDYCCDGDCVQVGTGTMGACFSVTEGACA